MFLSDPFFNNFKEKCYIDGERNKMELNDKDGKNGFIHKNRGNIPKTK